MTLINKILEDIEKTGFVTELRTVTLLADNDWRTTHSSTYQDLDFNISREIDIVATKVQYIKEFDFRLIIELVIEVKKTDRPWIVFTTDRKLATDGWRILKKSKNTTTRNKEHGWLETIFEAETIRANNYRTPKARIGKAFHELAKSPTDKSKIYESLMTVCKASSYLKAKYSDEKETGDFDVNKEVELTIYLPTVVVDGLLFEAYQDLSNKIVVEESKFIPVEMSYSSEHYREGRWDITYLPDIVTLDNLQKHVEDIEKWRTSMLANFMAILKQLGKLPDKRYGT